MGGVGCPQSSPVLTVYRQDVRKELETPSRGSIGLQRGKQASVRNRGPGWVSEEEAEAWIPRFEGPALQEGRGLGPGAPGLREEHCDLDS